MADLINKLVERMLFGVSSQAGKSIIPRRSIAGSSLLGVIAIMSFLACMCAGGVSIVARSAANWQSDIMKEITIQVLPVSGQSIEATLATALEIVESTSGVDDAEIVGEDETLLLLQPWIGTQLSIDELPIPRLIVASITASQLDLQELTDRLNTAGEGISVDDHSTWTNRLSILSGTTIAVGLILLVLTFTATALSVAFATRGAMAGNREIVEVMNIVGATNGFIATEFQKHFLVLGLKGGALGGVCALLCFAAIALYASGRFSAPGHDQFAFLIDVFAPNIWGYASIIGVIVAIGLITALTSRNAAVKALRASGGRAG